MVIDFHTHVFPEKIAARTLEVLKAGIKREQGIDYPSFTDGTVSGLLDSMDRCGIDMSVVVPIATKPEQTATINAYAAQISGGRLLSFGSVHPADPNALGVLEELAQAGFKGIKMHPEFQHFYIDSPESLAILRKCEELGLYVTLHTGADVGMPPPVHCTPEMLVRVLDKVSGERIIAAHMGSFWMWEDVRRLLVGSPLYFDTAVVGMFIEPGVYRDLIRDHGADRVLFASDSPWEDQAHALDTLRSLGLSPEEFEKITCKNACHILGVKKV
ncbi:MAG: amidohydrolase family protein [Clostridia bacterium]|nr:amidohydrolase family protein [Clostridia bacterium]